MQSANSPEQHHNWKDYSAQFNIKIAPTMSYSSTEYVCNILVGKPFGNQEEEEDGRIILSGKCYDAEWTELARLYSVTGFGNISGETSISPAGQLAGRLVTMGTLFN